MPFEPSMWTSSKLLPLGGGWAFAVGVLEDGTIRIAKGKTEGANANAPISQVQKLNLKAKDRQTWEQIKAEVDALYAKVS